MNSYGYACMVDVASNRDIQKRPHMWCHLLIIHLKGLQWPPWFGIILYYCTGYPSSDIGIKTDSNLPTSASAICLWSKCPADWVEPWVMEISSVHHILTFWTRKNRFGMIRLCFNDAVIPKLRPNMSCWLVPVAFLVSISFCTLQAALKIYPSFVHRTFPHTWRGVSKKGARALVVGDGRWNRHQWIKDVFVVQSSCTPKYTIKAGGLPIRRRLKLYCYTYPCL